MSTGPASASAASARPGGRMFRVAPVAAVFWACLAVVVVRLIFVTQPLRYDESGYLIVARQWDGDGPFPYGDYWVDRPPGLLLIFRVASLFDSDRAVRVLAIPFAVLFVVAAARAAWLLGGASSARVATCIAAALVATPATGADQANGELFAASLVMAAIALLLEACHRDTNGARGGLAIGAGVLGAAAPLVKQNFVEALVFAAVMLMVMWRSGRYRQPGTALIAKAALLGAAIPPVAVLIWTYAAWFDVEVLAYDLMGFRADALAVILEVRSPAAVTRGRVLILLGILSGIIPILVCMVRAGWRGRHSGSPAGWATAAIAALGILGITAGGSYWPHYLLQLAPATALGVALMATGPMRRSVTRLCVAAACSAVIASTGLAVFYLNSPAAMWPQRTGEWLKASSAPGDTALVVYGSAAVQHRSGLDSPYPYLWSLPVRVLDPELDRLEATLRGPEAPSWIVQTRSFDAWGLDEDEGLRSTVEGSYRVVAEVCGKPVWLRSDLTRDLADLPDC